MYGIYVGGKEFNRRKVINMEVGTVADWVSAIGGLLAVIAAIISWRVSVRALYLQQEQDEREKVRERREQASLVVAMGARLPERGDDEEWGLYLYNGSDRPVTDVVVNSQHIRTHKENYPLEIGMLPPGRFVVPSHKQYHWGSLIDLDHTNEHVEYLVKGKGMEMVKQMSFVDSGGMQWCKQDSELREKKDHTD